MRTGFTEKRGAYYTVQAHTNIELKRASGTGRVYLQDLLFLHFPIVKHRLPVQFFDHGKTILFRLLDDGENGVFAFVFEEAVNVRVSDGF